MRRRVFRVFFKGRKRNSLVIYRRFLCIVSFIREFLYFGWEIGD